MSSFQEKTFTHDGLTKTPTEWAEHFGISYAHLYGKMMTSGWDYPKAIAALARSRSVQMAKQ